MAKWKKSTFERLNASELNRKQRRDLGRRLAAKDPGLAIVHSNAGGIDVGNDMTVTLWGCRRIATLIRSRSLGAGRLTSNEWHSG